MTQLCSPALPVRMETDSAGSPARFFFRDLLHRVLRIEQRWQIDTDWWDAEGRVHRDYYAVTTLEGALIVLCYDHLEPGWYISRVYD